MPATTLKLSDELKARVTTLARDAGRSPHAFMIDAIERQTLLAERRKAFVASALASREETLRTGSAYDAKDVHAYFAARAEGKPARRPRLKRWRK